LVIQHVLVSPEHARVRAGREGQWLLDSESPNGTYVNGERVNGESVKLQHFDTITLGKLAAPVHLVFLEPRETVAVPTEAKLPNP